jgi:hypothetical protein
VTPEIREILQALGTGGTREMAERVKTWVDTRRRSVVLPGIPPENLLGLAEVSALTRIPEGTIDAWATFEQVSFPAPAATLAATKVWDRDQVAVWMRGHPDLLGDKQEA